MTLPLFGLEGNCLESRETRRDRPKPPPQCKNPPRQPRPPGTTQIHRDRSRPPATARNYNPRITFAREKVRNFGKTQI